MPSSESYPPVLRAKSFQAASKDERPGSGLECRILPNLCIPRIAYPEAMTDDRRRSRRCGQGCLSGEELRPFAGRHPGQPCPAIAEGKLLENFTTGKGKGQEEKRGIVGHQQVTEKVFMLSLRAGPPLAIARKSEAIWTSSLWDKLRNLRFQDINHLEIAASRKHSSQ
jgi:hypothetical protein